MAAWHRFRFRGPAREGIRTLRVRSRGTIAKCLPLFGGQLAIQRDESEREIVPWPQLTGYRKPIDRFRGIEATPRSSAGSDLSSGVGGACVYLGCFGKRFLSLVGRVVATTP